MLSRRSPIDRFLQSYASGNHEDAMRAYDAFSSEPEPSRAALDAVLLACSGHNDPQLTVPHGMATAEAVREAFEVSRFVPHSSLQRFLTLLSFTLPRRVLDPDTLAVRAREVPGVPWAEALHEMMLRRHGTQASVIAVRLALEEGVDAAGAAFYRFVLRDLGKLGHNLILAASFVEAARYLGMPRALVPLANLGHLLSETHHVGEREALPETAPSGAVPDGERLEEVLADGRFEEVEAMLIDFSFSDRWEEAFVPLLVGASLDPGFLGHSLEQAHAARLACRLLAPGERSFLLWKLYRTVTTRFEYPAFLELRDTPPEVDREGVLSGFRATLEHRTPPAEETLRLCLELGVPMDRILHMVVANYGHWTVGEKDHTIAYLNAAIQTANFLGRDRALLPLAVALSKLPF